MRFAKHQSVAETDYGDETYYFCTEHCKEVFRRDPGRFVVADGEGWEGTDTRL
jgi:YHS domain-containing protein